MEQHTSSTSRVRVLVLCLVLFSLFVIAPAVFLASGSKSNAAEQKGGAIGASPSSTAKSARLAGAAQLTIGQKEPQGATGGYSYKNDTSPPLSKMPQLPVIQRPEHEAAANPKLPNHNHKDEADPVIQSFLAPDVMPATIRNFDGTPFPGVACNCAPPDTDGEVGLTQYVQMVNEGYQVFNKATGASVLGPSGITTIWQGFGGVCELNGDGDPVVLYDQFANRWVISQFAGAGVPTDECVAVSTSSDATGSYNRYGFHLGTNFFDYPHLGVWPVGLNNGYFMSMNVFNSAGTAFLGTQAFAFDRAAMIAGTAAAFVTPGLTTGGANNEAFLPADLDGSTIPASGTPCPFVEFPDGGNGNTYRTWLMHPDFVVPANTTFVQRTSPAAAGFTFLCGSTRACVPQGGGGTTNLDAIADRPMFRLPYRIVGGVERIVGNFTVSSNSVAGIRWFELRNVTSGVESVFQESTYQPDTTWRWMGSAAQDQNGDMALGFSASDATIFPQIRYAGRLVGDPANTLAQGEAHMFDGLGSQTGTGSRWGDYSDLTIDPVDDCTFWYTQEYYPAGVTSFNWRTRVASFKFASCNSTSPVLTSAGATLVSESCAPANGAIDPNETVTVSFCVQNVGGVNTTAAMTGTLQNTGGVTGASAPAVYGVVVAGGAPVCRNFTFTAAGACGGTLTATIHFQDGATDLGNITYTFTLGVLTTTTAFSQNFDGVVAPALPAGWTTSSSGVAAANWVTSTTTPDTAPNDAFAPDMANIADDLLTSPTIAIPAGGASSVTFKNLYNMESTFDGMVLEISINGGAFADITAGGGAFTAGGYNSTISTAFGSPIGGRPAWSGLSGGTSAAPTYITSTATLPTAAAGANIQLRWRAASDNSVSAAGAAGVRVDTITITRSAYVCCTPSATPCSENFDGVTPPALPAGWVASTGATCVGSTVWVTSNSGTPTPVADTAPNSAFTNDPGCISDERLDSPNWSVTSATATLSFRQNRNLESGFDGCVLEVSVNGGAFQDILTAGGTFGTNGYNGTISVNFGSPIAGRMAWTGSTSSAFVTTTVNLPASANGQMWRFRWRRGSDSSVAAVGFRLDTITTTGTSCGGVVPCALSCPANITKSNDPNQCGAVVTYPAPTSSGGCGAITCSPASGSFFPKGTTTVTCTSGTGGGSCSFTVTVNDTQPPTITCPANIAVAAPATCPPTSGRPVTFAPTASDNCPGVTVVCTPASGSIFPVGTTTVTCTATDTSGNTATCTFTVTVFSACLQDETVPGNVVLFNTRTGEYRFCCGGVLQATGTGVLNIRGCIGTIADQKGNRKVEIEFDFSAQNGAGKGTAALFLNGSTNPKCSITDQNMSNNNCTCGAPPTQGEK
jgi:hypothetical protein